MKWFYVNWNSNNNQFSGIKSFPFPCWPFQFWWLFRWLHWWQQKNIIINNNNNTLHSNGYNGGNFLFWRGHFSFSFNVQSPEQIHLFFYCHFFLSLSVDKDKQWTHNFWRCYCAYAHARRNIVYFKLHSKYKMFFAMANVKSVNTHPHWHIGPWLLFV